MVVLPASGCEMIAKVRRSEAESVIGFLVTSTLSVKAAHYSAEGIGGQLLYNSRHT